MEILKIINNIDPIFIYDKLITKYSNLDFDLYLDKIIFNTETNLNEIQLFLDSIGCKTVKAKIFKEKPKKIKVDDLLISFNEAYNDYLIYTPWADNEYITKIGDFILGFSERNYLAETLKKIKQTYGEEIGVGLIDSKPIPTLTEPLIRRHGKKMKIKVINRPLSEKDYIKIEQRVPYSADWENMTGDEYSSKNVNEAELWRPIHQHDTLFKN